MAAKVIAFKVVIEGVETAIRNEQQLADAVKAVRKEYKAADYGTEGHKQAAATLGRLKKLQAESRQEVRDLGREYEQTRDKGQQSYRALNAELVNLRRQYKEMPKAERQLAGRDTLKRISQLDKELKEIDAEMGQYQRNVGNYADAFGGIGQALSDLGGIDITAIGGALTNPATLVAGLGAATASAVHYTKELTTEYRNLQNRVEILTGAAGAELDRITNSVLAIGETFGAETTEVTQAANALAENIGIGFEDAVARIEQGYVAGLDLNGEFLDSLREYPTFFAEAFGPGEQAANAFFEVIRRGNEQGVFNDKAVDAIKEVTLRLRELPTATRDALDAIGIASDDIRQQIEQDGIGAAIATVATRLGELEADAPETGQALADIFGGPGEDAGLAFITSLGDIDEATGNLLETTSEYQDQQLETLEVNRRFAEAQGEVAAAFGGTGTSMENVVTKGRTLLLQFLAPVITFFGDLFRALQPISGGLLEIAQDFGLVSKEGDTAARAVEGFTNLLESTVREVETIVGWITALNNGLNTVNDTVTGAGESVNGFFRSLLGLGQAVEDLPEFGGGGAGGEYEEAARGVDGLTQAQREGRAAMEQYAEAQRKAAEENEREGESLDSLRARLASLNKQRDAAEVGSSAFNALGREIATVQATIDRYTKSQKEAGVVAEKFARDSIGFLQAQLARLNEELKGATGESERELVIEITGVEEAIQKIEDGRQAIRNEVSRLGDDLEPVSILPATDSELNKLTQTQDAIRQQQQAFDDELTERVVENSRSRAERVAENEAQALAEREEKVQIITEGIFSAFDTVNSALAEGVARRADREVAAIERRYQAEIDAAEGSTREQERLREELAAREREIRRREFEEQKKLRTAAALASLASGVINILSAPTVIPDPAGQIYKGVQVGILAATTAAQIAQIQSQTLAERGLLITAEGQTITRTERKTSRRRAASPGTGLRAAIAAENGQVVNGWVRGQSHRGPAGGVSLHLNGRSVLVEHGEKIDYDEHGNAVVVNRRSAAAHRDELSRMHGRSFVGKGERLEQINRYRSYGSAFGGLSDRYAAGGYLTFAPALSGLQALSEANRGVAAAGTATPAATLDAQSVADIARATAEAVYRGSREGTADGAGDANRRREREARVQRRTRN
jgi:DNA repair exonuclease SbcCD ATPase subunit